MAGEDPELVQIKPGYQVGLVFNQDNEVTKIIINNKSKHPEAKVVQVERIDLEHDLVIEAYNEDEEKVSYPVHEKAKTIQDEMPTQIAPWKRQFGSKTVGQRALAIFAGPLMNFILAFLLLTAFSWMQGVPVDEAEIGLLAPDGAASEAGLQENDRITSIAGEPVNTWEEMTEIIQQHPNNPISFEVERNGESLNFSVTPEAREIQEGEIQGFIGIGQPSEFNFLGSIAFGAQQTYLFTTMIFEVLGMIITGDFSLDYIAGPVGIFNYTGEAASMGIFVLMQWAAALSVNLGIINLLPIPAMDGGRLIFLGLEAVRGNQSIRKRRDGSSDWLCPSLPACHCRYLERY